MTPGVSATDSFYVTFAGHHPFGRSLRAGVRISEYQPILLHQKTITVDGEWCAIGSANFDDRSFETNDEIMVSIADRDTVGELEGIFDGDVKDCIEIIAEEWEKRSLFRRLTERVFYPFNQ